MLVPLSVVFPSATTRSERLHTWGESWTGAGRTRGPTDLIELSELIWFAEFTSRVDASVRVDVLDDPYSGEESAWMSIFFTAAGTSEEAGSCFVGWRPVHDGGLKTTLIILPYDSTNQLHIHRCKPVQ